MGKRIQNGKGHGIENGAGQGQGKENGKGLGIEEDWEGGGRGGGRYWIIPSEPWGTNSYSSGISDMKGQECGRRHLD